MKKTLKRMCASILSVLMLAATISSTSAFAAQEDDSSTQPAVGNLFTAEENTDTVYSGATGDNTLNEENPSGSADIISSVDEYYNIIGDDNNGGLLKSSASSYPVNVDNSTSPYFPIIDSQGQIGSCTCWAETYYQFTYAMNKSMGRTTTPSNTFSPKWTYALINDGVDRGSNSTDCFEIMKTQGTATMGQVPYDNDYLSWSPVESIWQSAGDYRISNYQYIDMNSEDTPITAPDDSDLDVLKAALSQGEILTYSTYISSWQYKDIVANSSVPENNSHAGDRIAIAMNGSSGGHRMTIVGYNDNIWVDINGDGQVQNQEKGAFKIANSWGTDYCNDGFSWVSYDALNRVSSVAGVAPKSNRASIFQYIARIDVEPYNTDSNIVLKYTLNSKTRNYTRVFVEAEKYGNKYTAKVTPYGNGYYDFYGYDNYSFNGTANYNDGSMCFDLDRIFPNISSDTLSEYNWNIRFQDTEDDGNTLTVKDVKIVNENNGRVYNRADSTPITLDGSEQTVNLSQSSTKEAVIYYRGYLNPNIHYQVGNGSWTTVPGVAMEKSTEKDGYTHKYIIPLGNAETAKLCFNDGNGNWDNNNGNDYTVSEGINTFITQNANVPQLKINSFTSDCENGITNINVGNFFVVDVQGGYEAYQYEFIYKNLGTNETETENYKFYNKAGHWFRTAGNYMVTVNVKDVAGTIVSESLYLTVEDNNVEFSSFNVTPNSDIYTGTALTFSASTKYENVLPYMADEFSLTIKKDGQIYATPSIVCNDWNVNKLTSFVSTTWTPTEAGEYTATIAVIDSKNKTAQKTISFTVEPKVFKLVSFDITPSDGYITAGESICMTANAINAGLSGYLTRFDCTREDGSAYASYNYSYANSVNFQITKAGTYNVVATVKETPYSEPITSEVKTIHVAEKTNAVTIYYNGYSTPNIHYQIGSGAWTNVPGFPMVETNELSGYTHKYTINLGTSTYANVCFNDGNGNWDSKNGENYQFQSGVYTYSNGTITSIG